MASPGEEDGSTSNPDPDDALTQELPLDLEGDPAAPDGRRRKRKFLLIGAAVVLIAGLATGLTLAFTGGSPATGLVVTSETVKVTTGTIKQTVATSGTLEPATQADLNFGVSGTVTGVDVQAGQAVTAGQVLATVGTTALNSDVDAAQANLAAAEARLSADEAAGGSTTEIDSDEASVTSAESSLSTAQNGILTRLVDLHYFRHGGLGQSHGRPGGDRDRDRDRRRRHRWVGRGRIRRGGCQYLVHVHRADRGHRD